MASWFQRVVKELGCGMAGVHGADWVRDMRRGLPGQRVEVIFDVGANVGQSAREFVRGFGEARIYCFEPVSANFEKLRKRMRGKKRVMCLQMAMGKERGQGKMVLEEATTDCYLAEAGGKELQERGRLVEEVRVETVDDFCRQEGIGRIDFLKIDTEGRDLEVMMGAKEMLGGGRIEMIEAEVGMNPENKRHVPMEKVKGYLESFGYRIWGVYEQVHEWPGKEPQLRRCNVIFISGRVIEKYRGRCG